MHKSVRGILKEKDRIVLIHRIKSVKGEIKDYFVIPGGKMEDEETEEETLIREMYEELGIKVKPLKRVLEYNNFEYDGSIQIYYECEFVSGEIGTGQGEEIVSKDKDYGEFIPVIIDIKEIENINLVPYSIKQKILELYK